MFTLLHVDRFRKLPELRKLTATPRGSYCPCCQILPDGIYYKSEEKQNSESYNKIPYSFRLANVHRMDIIQVKTLKSEPQEGQEVKDEVSEAEARAACSAFLEGEIIDLEEDACAVKEEAQEFAEELSESYGNCLEIGTSSAAGNI